MLNQGSLHREHQNWQQEYEPWFQDISLWEKDHKRALAELRRIEDAIYAHSAQIKSHAEALHAWQAEMHSHEQTMAAQERAGEADDLVQYQALVLRHREAAQEHAALQASHETRQEHHTKYLVQILRLSHELNEDAP
jgi:hypothetical protein